ncbi:MAG: hypothetical protein AAGK05_12635, partial [Pseudomonadota bacterium]
MKETVDVSLVEPLTSPAESMNQTLSVDTRISSQSSCNANEKDDSCCLFEPLTFPAESMNHTESADNDSLLVCDTETKVLKLLQEMNERQKAMEKEITVIKTRMPGGSDYGYSDDSDTNFFQPV